MLLSVGFCMIFQPALRCSRYGKHYDTCIGKCGWRCLRQTAVSVLQGRQSRFPSGSAGMGIKEREENWEKNTGRFSKSGGRVLER